MADGDEKKVMIDETREEPWKYEAERVCDMDGLILVPERLVVASLLFYFILIPVFFQDEPWPFEDSQHGGGQGLLDESESHGREEQGKEEVQITAEEEGPLQACCWPPGKRWLRRQLRLWDDWTIICRNKDIAFILVFNFET